MIPLSTPGMDNFQITFAEGLELIGPQIVGSLDQGFVHFAQGCMDRDDHKGHKVTDQANHYGKVRIHHCDRGNPQYSKQVVDDTIV